MSNNLLYKAAHRGGHRLCWRRAAYLIGSSTSRSRTRTRCNAGPGPRWAPSPTRPANAPRSGLQSPIEKGAHRQRFPPRPRPRPAELVMLDLNHTAAAEAYRVLRTNLQFAAVAHPVRWSSPARCRAANKSVVSANLAIAVAQASFRGLLDCDLHRPPASHLRAGQRAGREHGAAGHRRGEPGRLFAAGAAARSAS